MCPLHPEPIIFLIHLYQHLSIPCLPNNHTYILLLVLEEASQVGQENFPEACCVFLFEHVLIPFRLWV